jgi:hypothetical protein
MKSTTNLQAVPGRPAAIFWDWQGHLGRLIQASDAKRAAALTAPAAEAPAAATPAAHVAQAA